MIQFQSIVNPMNPESLPQSSSASQGPLQSRSTWRKKLLVVFGVIIACCGITAAATAWWVKRNVYASPLQPVTLSLSEQSAFDQKVQALSGVRSEAPLDPEAVAKKEAEEKRTIKITAREINAFLEKQGLGEQVKIELSNGALAATALVPVDPEVPFIGGTTLRLKLGLSGSMGADQKPAFKVTDVSVGGVPLPNAWLGDMKGVNLLASNVEADPVVKQFMAGIREFEIHEGTIRVLLNE